MINKPKIVIIEVTDGKQMKPKVSLSTTSKSWTKFHVKQLKFEISQQRNENIVKISGKKIKF